MGRRRHRHQNGNGGNGGNGHPGEEGPLVVLPESLLSETLGPSYRPVKGDPTAVLAPVLELEGLEPWAEIEGPALMLEEPAPGDDAVTVFDDPSQLVLEPTEGAHDGAAQRSGTDTAHEGLREEDDDFETEVWEPADVDADSELEVLEMEAEELEEVVAEAPGFVEEAAASGAPADEDVPMAPPIAGVDAIETAEVDPPAAEPSVAEGKHAAPTEAPVETVAAAEADTPAEAAPAVAEAPAPAEPPKPDPVELLYAEAREAADAGNAEDAKRLYRQLLAAHPTHVRARNNLALLLDAEGNHQGALAELDRAVDVESENTTLLVNRGAMLGAMGRFAAAEHDLRKVLRVEPSHAEALFNLGVVMSKKGLWAEAVPHLKRAVELEPDRAAAHYYLGEALNHVDDLHGALAAYQRATELQPANPRALYGLGIIYDRLARPDDAARMYRRSREVSRR